MKRDYAWLKVSDKYILDPIVRNLIANAIKFTNKKGLIVLKAIKKENEFEISVEDGGVGIRARDLRELFKIENSVTTKGTANEEGTGLGLILCKEMVEKHGGKISVKSEFGIGTTFTFSIPVLVHNDSKGAAG